jgi:FtsP/CotA-like multicopper oxidase with cupredoxin domain
MRAFIGARKRLATCVSLVVAFAVSAFVISRIEGPALATSDGSAYTVPLVDDINPDPDIVETTIVAQAAGVDIGLGADVSVLTFNGTIPGPEFRLKVGDTVIVHFRNEIAHATGIHWHGIELANAADGTPLTQNMVPPGDTFLYKFKVSRPGIYWYHPHHHSSTNQVFKGMYGSIIVSDPDEQSLEGSILPTAADTRTLVLSDLTVCKTPGSNDTVNFPPSLPHASGGPLPAQPGPSPQNICEGAPEGDALDEDGNPRGDYAAGEVPNIQKSGTNGRVNEGQTVLTNGINVGHRDGSPTAPGALAAGGQALDVVAGQGLRFQLINAATTRFFRLILTDAAGVQVPLVRVGGQGGLLDHARVEGNAVEPPPAGTFDFKYTQGEILLDPGDRQDVVITIPASATAGQVLTMWTQDFRRTGPAGNFAGIPTVPVAHFMVTGGGGSYSLAPGAALRASIAGAAVEVLGVATAALLDPTAFSPAKPGLSSQDIELNATGTELQVNGHRGSHDFPGDYAAIPHEDSARYAVEIGDTLELTVNNTTNAHHPFHLHGFSIQPIELFKAGGPNYTFGYAEFRDNIDVPANYTLRYRVRLDDRPLMDGVTMGGGTGRWVFHCHIFFHAVFGMISEFVVSGADGNERPYINADDTLLEGAASDTLTMTGTYADPDHDTPIALSASVGTITDDGDGQHWTWTHTGATSGLVYVTATDADGLKDQVAFQLKVNAPPVLILPGPQTGVYSDPLTFGISATDPDDDPIVLGASGLPPSLTLVDHGNGTGTVGGNLTTIPGVYVATFTANDGHNTPVSGTVEITITKETTTLEYIGPTVILNGATATLSGRLLEDDGPPVIGRTVSFTLGAQGCNGATNATGVASCNLLVSGTLGSVPITANFAGDAFYLPSSDSDTAIVFAFPTKGAFVLGNGSSATGSTVMWWGAQWAKNNILSGGAAPNAFKGFAENVSLPTSTPPATCGAPWTSSPGNSGAPPATVPQYMGVLVSSSINKSGSSISGNTTQIVVVNVAAGYGPSPGKAGTGTVVAVFCP